MPYIATVNMPGYLPDNEEPWIFDTAKEAWEFLADQRSLETDESAQDDDEAIDFLDEDTTLSDLRRYTSDGWPVADFERVGSIWGPTPGRRTNDPRDLGLIYAVAEVEPEVVESWFYVGHDHIDTVLNALETLGVPGVRRDVNIVRVQVPEGTEPDAHQYALADFCNAVVADAMMREG